MWLQKSPLGTLSLKFSLTHWNCCQGLHLTQYEKMSIYLLLIWFPLSTSGRGEREREYSNICAVCAQAPKLGMACHVIFAIDAIPVTSHAAAL